jgi:hypothetical protein
MTERRAPRLRRPPPGRSALVAALGLALASEARAGDPARADALFEEGKQLMAAGRFAEACQRFADSQREEPAGGTVLHLALCREQEGRVATAWSTFQEALRLAREQGRADRERIALERIAALEGRITRLIVLVEPKDAGLAGLEVRRDDATIPRDQWGTSVPVDPGVHRVIATAPGKRRWQRDVEVKAGIPITLVTVSGLEDEGAAAAPPAPVARPKPRPVEAPPRVRLRVGVGGALAVGAEKTLAEPTLTPALGGDLRAQAGVRGAGWSAAIEGRFALPQEAAGRDGEVIDTSLVAVGLVPCGHLGYAFGCATGVLGAFHADASGEGEPAQTGLFGAAGPRVGVELPFGERLAGQLHADFLLARPVHVRRGGEDVLETSPLTASLGLTLFGAL